MAAVAVEAGGCIASKLRVACNAWLQPTWQKQSGVVGEHSPAHDAWLREDPCHMRTRKARARRGNNPQSHAKNEGICMVGRALPATWQCLRGWGVLPPPHMPTITARCMAGEFSRTQNKLMLDDGWSLLAGHAGAPRERSRSASSSRSSNFIPCRGFDGMLVLVSQAETLAACSMGAFKYAPIYYAQLAFARAPT